MNFESKILEAIGFMAGPVIAVGLTGLRLGLSFVDDQDASWEERLVKFGVPLASGLEIFLGTSAFMLSYLTEQGYYTWYLSLQGFCVSIIVTWLLSESTYLINGSTTLWTFLRSVAEVGVGVILQGLSMPVFVIMATYGIIYALMNDFSSTGYLDALEVISPLALLPGVILMTLVAAAAFPLSFVTPFYTISQQPLLFVGPIFTILSPGITIGTSISSSLFTWFGKEVSTGGQSMDVKQMTQVWKDEATAKRMEAYGFSSFLDLTNFVYYISTGGYLAFQLLIAVGLFSGLYELYTTRIEDPAEFLPWRLEFSNSGDFVLAASGELATFASTFITLFGIWFGIMPNLE